MWDSWGMRHLGPPLEGPASYLPNHVAMLGRAERGNTRPVPWELRIILLSGLGSFEALLTPALKAVTTLELLVVITLKSLIGVMVLTLTVHSAGSCRQSTVQRPA